MKRFEVLFYTFTLAVCICLVWVSTSHATTILGPSTYQAWSDESKAPTPESTVTIVEISDPSPCKTAGTIARACVEQKKDGKLWTAGPLWREDLYHELGHVFDALYLTDADRDWFASKVWMSGPWLDTLITGNTPGEIFATQYAQCAIFGKNITEWKLLLPPNDTPIGKRMHRRFCTWIEQAYVH